ncbi:unnamed protein product [Closterium sp. NIES-53]
MRTTLAALGFAPSTADPSLFLRTDAAQPPFYVLVYVDDLVFATADTEALAHVKSELQKRHTCTDLGELTSYLGLRITRDRAQRTITLTHSHMVQQSIEPSGPYPELVGCLMYLMTCTRPDLAYPLSLLARYVAPGRHRKVHWDAAKRVLRYLCSTSVTGLVLGGRARVVLTGHADASWIPEQVSTSTLAHWPSVSSPDTAPNALRLRDFLDDVSELQKRHTCTDLGELTSYLGLRITRDKAQRTITLTHSHMVQQSIEPSGPYPELVGCLMYLMTCTRPDLAYPLSLLARYVAPGRHRKVHWDAAKRVLRYLCSTSVTGLVLGGRARVVLTGHADASWVDDLATQRSSQGYTFSLGSGSVSWRSTHSSSVLSSSFKAEIYAGAMAA